MRQENPVSLSYQLRTFTMLPSITMVEAKSMLEDHWVPVVVLVMRLLGKLLPLFVRRKWRLG
jgi:hypothetical protein